MTSKIEELLITLIGIILAFAIIIISLKYQEFTATFLAFCLTIMAVRGLNWFVNNL
ncbi:MAG: hypothetical protein KAJ19_30220 [Gammaproteobacteria bacterium]|nr:hypothetical protein [Gammaproteobacteria bacterium]